MRMALSALLVLMATQSWGEESVVLHCEDVIGAGISYSDWDQEWLVNPFIIQSSTK